MANNSTKTGQVDPSLKRNADSNPEDAGSSSKMTKLESKDGELHDPSPHNNWSFLSRLRNYVFGPNQVPEGPTTEGQGPQDCSNALGTIEDPVVDITSLKRTTLPPEMQDADSPSTTSPPPALPKLKLSFKSCISGLEPQIKSLEFIITCLLQQKTLQENWGQLPPKGLLLHGPSGTGKTLIAKAFVDEIETRGHHMNFLALNGAETHILNSVKLQSVFAEAKTKQPCIVLLEKLDKIISNTDMTSSLVTELDTLLPPATEVFIIGITTTLKGFPDSLLRRFENHVQFDLPKEQERLGILKLGLATAWKNMPDEDLLRLVASKTDGFDGKELKAVCNGVVAFGIERVLGLSGNADDLVIEQSDWESAVNKVKPPAVGSSPPPPWPITIITTSSKDEERSTSAVESKSTAPTSVSSTAPSGSATIHLGSGSQSETSAMDITSPKMCIPITAAPSAGTNLQPEASKINHAKPDDVSPALKAIAEPQVLLTAPAVSPITEVPTDGPVPEAMVVTEEPVVNLAATTTAKAKTESAGTPKFQIESIVGGLTEQIKSVKLWAKMIALQQDMKDAWGEKPAKGILFYGLPGTGKNLLAGTVVEYLGSQGSKMKLVTKQVAFVPITPSDTPKHLKDYFGPISKAKEPTLVMIQGIDLLCPYTPANGTTSALSTVSFLSEVDALPRGKVFLIATSMKDKLSDIDPNLLKDGRFEQQVHFTAPTEPERLEILKLFSSKWRQRPSEEILATAVAETEGFNGAQLQHLCRKAICNAMERSPALEIKDMQIEEADWKAALDNMKKANPSLNQAPKPKPQPGAASPLNSILGLPDQIAAIKKIILSLTKCGELKKFGIQPSKGILFYGPPGSAKRTVAKALAEELKFQGIKVNVFSKTKEDLLPQSYSYLVPTELKAAYSEAKAKAPSVIIIEDLTAICSYEDGSSGSYGSVVQHLLKLIGDVKDGAETFTIGTVNTADLQKVDPLLTGLKSFEKPMIFNSLKSDEMRLQLLKLHVKDWEKQPSTEMMEFVATKTKGCSSGELKLICQRAVRHGMEGCKEGTEVEVGKADWEKAIEEIPPAAEASSLVEDKDTAAPSLESCVGGLSHQLDTVKGIIKSLTQQDVLRKVWGQEPPKGIIFHGPPGTGKTLLAKTIADELTRQGMKMNFMIRKGADLESKWVGEAQKNVTAFFQQAVQKQPSLIFLDEIDALCPTRGDSSYSKIVTPTICALLSAMDSLPRGKVFVIGATNRIDSLDPALRRPGRFDKEMLFTLPNCVGRRQILKIHTSKWKLAPTDEILRLVAEKTEGYTGADLEQLCRHVFNTALGRVEKEVDFKGSIEEAMDTTEPVQVLERITHAGRQDVSSIEAAGYSQGASIVCEKLEAEIQGESPTNLETMLQDNSNLNGDSETILEAVAEKSEKIPEKSEDNSTFSEATSVMSQADPIIVQDKLPVNCNIDSTTLDKATPDKSSDAPITVQDKVAENSAHDTTAIVERISEGTKDNSSEKSQDESTDVPENSVEITKKETTNAIEKVPEKSFPEPNAKPKSSPLESALENMQILLPDWLEAVRTSKRSPTNVFGSGCGFTGQDLVEEMKPLLGQVAKELELKLTSCFPGSSSSASSCRQLNLKILHFWSQSDLSILNSHIIPCILTSIDSEKIPTWQLSLESISQDVNLVKGLENTFNQIRSCFKETKVVFIPDFTRFWEGLSSQLQNTFVQFLESTRGERLVFLITSSRDYLNHDSSLQWLQNCSLLSSELRQPNERERRQLFSAVWASVTDADLKGRLDSSVLNDLVECTRSRSIGSMLALQGQMALMYSRSTCAESVAADDMLQNVAKLIEEYKNPTQVHLGLCNSVYV